MAMRWIMAAATLLLSATGCSRVEVYRLTEETFPRKPDDAEIKLYENKVQRRHREIAFIDSQPLSDRSEESKEKQLVQIQKAARKLGADAVHDIRYRTERVEGMVVDQAVPFQAFKQGRYKLYFLRGTAIVYTGDGSATVTPSPEISPSDLAADAAPTPVAAPLIQGPSPNE